MFYPNSLSIPHLLATVGLAMLISASPAVFGQGVKADPATVTLVKNKTALFRIVAAEGARGVVDPETVTTDPLICTNLPLAVRDLAVYTRKSTGAEPEIVLGKAPNDELINVHVGMTEYVKDIVGQLDLPTPHGFVIAFPDEKNIVIAGTRLEGQELNARDGVYYFLETYLGVRWLFPGELGEYVPQRDTLSIPVTTVRRTPSFMERTTGGWHRVHSGGLRKNIEPVRYSRRMGRLGWEGLRYSHNIGNIIDPEKYGKTHPEFFPIYNGKRMIPTVTLHRFKKDRWRYWEPCYTAEGIVDEGAKQIIEHFDNHPDQYTFAFGVNDGGKPCECDRCREKNKNLPETCESQTYYEWVNAVVKEVRKEYPDRYFGLIVYANVARMPENVVLDDHIVPVICWDLRYFADPVLGVHKTKQLLNDVSNMAPTFGWWNYTHAGHYFIPVFQARHVADSLKYLYEKGARTFHDEVYNSPLYKNAPQEYIKWKLLRDITLDPDGLLNEWYALAVGEKAAPHLAAYSALWEEYWTERVITSPWFKRAIEAEDVVPFLWWSDCRYMDVLTRDDLRQAQKELDKAVELADTAKQKARAQFFRDGFAGYRKRFLVPYVMHAEAQARRPETAGGKVLYASDWNAPLEGPNPEFQGWGKWQKKVGTVNTAKVYIDKEEGHAGKGSVCFHNEDSLGTSVSMNGYHLPSFDQYVPGKTYAFSVWAKANTSVDSYRMPALVVNFVTKGGKPIHRFFQLKDNLPPEYEPGEWRELRVYFVAPETGWEDIGGVRCILSRPYMDIGQKVWFDDFTITELRADDDAAEPNGAGAAAPLPGQR